MRKLLAIPLLLGVLAYVLLVPVEVQQAIGSAVWWLAAIVFTGGVIVTGRTRQGGGHEK